MKLPDEIKAVLDGESEGCIVQGDCLEVMADMPDGAVDISVTSPPYNIKGGTSPKSGMMAEWNAKINNDWYSDDLPEEEYQSWLRTAVGDAIRTSTGLVWLNHKTRYSNRVAIHPARFLPFPIYSEVVWDREGSIVFNAKKFAPSHEFILGFGVPHWWDSSTNTMLSVWRIKPERNIRSHPCPYPVEIPHRCIAASCPPDGIVLDPFCGIGTTCVAAKKLGRRYIGIELSEKYCRIARNRVKNTERPLFK
jgi:site-specific DNA-methyltransferase (adenine-specific)